MGGRSWWQDKKGTSRHEIDYQTCSGMPGTSLVHMKYPPQKHARGLYVLPDRYTRPSRAPRTLDKMHPKVLPLLHCRSMTLSSFMVLDARYRVVRAGRLPVVYLTDVRRRFSCAPTRHPC